LFDDKASNFGKEYLKLLVDEIRIAKEKVHLKGSYAALAGALCSGTELDFLQGVPSSVLVGSPDCTVERTFTTLVCLENTKKRKREPINPNYRNPIYVAKEYAQIIETGEAKSESDLARKMGISRVRVNQFIKLLKLDALIIRSIE